MASHRVAHHLDQRVHVEVVELSVQARSRVGVAHQRPRHRRVQPPLAAVLELVAMKRQEVRALAPADVDDLDVLPGPDFVAGGRRGVDPEVQAGLGQRRGQLHVLAPAGGGPPDLDQQLAAGRVPFDDPPAWHGHPQRCLAIGD